MNKLNVTIGSSIRRLRKAKHLSLEGLAELVGISCGYMGLIERGQRGTSLENLLKICRIFTCTIEDLIEGYDIFFEDSVNEVPRLIAYLTSKSITGNQEINFFINTAKALHEFMA